MLTATAARQAKPREKAYKVSDEKGLFLLLQPNGRRCWRLKYRFGGREKVLARIASGAETLPEGSVDVTGNPWSLPS